MTCTVNPIRQGPGSRPNHFDRALPGQPVGLFSVASGPLAVGEATDAVAEDDTHGRSWNGLVFFGIDRGNFAWCHGSGRCDRRDHEPRSEKLGTRRFRAQRISVFAPSRSRFKRSKSASLRPTGPWAKYSRYQSVSMTSMALGSGSKEGSSIKSKR